ncbi:PCD1 [Auxenochlorella protothecoides x Auxenochlorella symbiontica]
MLGALHPAELQICHISRFSWFKRAPAGRARAAGRRWQVPRAEHQEAPPKAGRDALAGLDAGALCLEIEPGTNNSRCIYASTDVPAPKETLWRLLTDYQHLNDFIPGLAVNQELETFPDGCKLLQVGQQELALGFKFTARCVLDIREHPDGIPGRLLRPNGGSGAGNGDRGRSAPLDGSSFPAPRSQMGVDAPHADIVFESVQGDFQVFKGLWRMQARDTSRAHLSYSLFVRPQRWLPVQLVQPRIEQEIRANLLAVCRHAACCHAAAGGGEPDAT